MTDAAAHGTHDHADDPRNAEILVNVNGNLVPRAQAVVSVFDAGFVLGDGVWEGLRVSAGHPAFLEQHFDRLWAGAAAIALDIGRTRDELTAEIYRTLEANGMDGDGVHIRLMVTRGPKSTPYQDPRMSAGPATVVIVAEHKDPLPSTVERGLTLFTVHVRRAYPDTLDPKLNAHSKLNDITACIQAYTAGADEALMLDPHGFVATCNSTHFFVVRGGEVWTSSGMYCLGGITRANVLRICGRAGHSGVRAQLQPHRRLQRGRGVRHRHVRRRRAGAHRRRADDRHRPARADGRAAPGPVPGVRPRRRRGARQRHERRSASRCGPGRATSRPR